MHRQHGRNYRFFDAPVGLIFSIDRVLQQGSWMDYGMFLQNIMVSARHFGLHTCPEASIAEFPAIRRHLGFGEGEMAVCGIALGYADPDDIINGFQPDRVAIDEFATFLE